MYIKLPMPGTCFFIWRFDLMILMGANPLLGPMILMGANSLLGPLEGVGSENLHYFVPTPSNGPRNEFTPHKIITSRAM
jgi:hypothetical protein